MAIQYSPKIVTDSLVMCLDASQNKSYPTDLPVKDGLNLWLDAADDTTFSYSSGTTVSQWRDKSGQNNHAVVMGGSPSRSVAINSRKAVSFTSTTSFKCVTGAFISTATHIVVCRATTSSATYQRVYHGGANSDHYVFIGALANNIATFWGNGSSWNDVNANSPSITILNTLRIISAINTGTSATPYYDGTAMTVKSTNPAAYTGYELNTYATGNLQPLVGEVCEIIVFNKQLSTTELKQVHTYLGQKWGISNTDRSIIDLSGFDDNGSFGGAAGSQTIANMPTFDFYNKGSLSFDGSNDYITIPSSASIKNTSSLTLEAWIYISNSMNYYGGIFGKGTTDTDEEYCLLVHSVNSKVYMDVGSGGGPYTDATFSFSLNTWYHIIGTHERAAGSSAIKIYVNGSLLSSSTVNPTNAVNDNSTAVTIGSRFSTGGSPWNGKIANAKIYTRTLSATEVAQNYEAQKSKFANTIVQQGLVLNLDAGNPYSYGGAGTTWYDVSGNARNATVNGAITFSDNYFNTGSTGTITNYITIPSAALNSLTSWTIQLWLNINSTNGIDTFLTCGAGNDFLWFFDGRSNLQFQNTSGSSISYPTTIGEWFLFTATGTGGSISVYKNGSSLGSFSNTTSITVNSAFGIVLGQELDDNTTGAFDATQAFLGKYGSVSFYNRVLSAAEVLQNYNATKGRFGL